MVKQNITECLATTPEFLSASRSEGASDVLPQVGVIVFLDRVSVSTLINHTALPTEQPLVDYVVEFVWVEGTNKQRQVRPTDGLWMIQHRL